MKRIFVFLIFFGLLLGFVKVSSAQSTPAPEPNAEADGAIAKPNEFFLARVIEIVEDGQKELNAQISQPYQKLKLKILFGSESGAEIEVSHGEYFAITDGQKVKRNDFVVLSKSFQPQGDIYYIADRYRVPLVGVVFLVILLVWAILGRGRNLGMLISLIGSFLISYKYLVPQLTLTKSPYLTIIIGIGLILALLIYVGYGLGRRSNIAFISSFITSLLILGISYLLFRFSFISGTGSEEAIFLQTGAIDPAGLKNLLLSGITVGALGIVSFVSLKQFDIYESLKEKNKKLKLKEVLAKSLINPDNNLSSYIAIVFIAYFGATLPLMILFTANKEVPFWVTFNSEFIMEEAIRILTSMAGIVLVVPITSFLLYFSKSD